MKLKYYNLQFLIIISLPYLFFTEIKAQDNLYLVGTITGESNDTRITDVKGIGDVNNDGYDDFIVSTIFDNTALLYLGSANPGFTPDLMTKIILYPGLIYN